MVFFWKLEQDHVEPLSVNNFTPNLNILFQKLIFEEVNVTSLEFLAIYVGVSDESNQEVEQDDEEKDNVHDEEHEPDQKDHDRWENAILFWIINTLCPERILRCSNITNRVSESLHKVNGET